ncbi:MAG: transketolase family protein [Armatimonadetes bacterium]|nr:transketolase family protein [Armatimonadota bacterium]
MDIGSTIGLKVGKATRVAFGETLRDLGAEDLSLVVVDADLNNSTRTDMFARAHPDRFFNVGIAESNMVGVAAGLAAAGKRAWCSSFATFVLSNAYDQLRMSVAFPGVNVKVVGSHSGISIGEDGPSQMGIEDMGLACSLPGFTVLVPCDERSTQLATRALHAVDGPGYLRTGRPNAPIVYEADTPWELGKATRLRDGTDLTLIANGLMVPVALEAAGHLEQSGVSVRVLDLHTLKPLDTAELEAAARETGRIVVVEEHLAQGGIGSIVAMAVAGTCPVPMRFVNLGDRFAESGSPESLMETYGLTFPAVVRAARELLPGRAG